MSFDDKYFVYWDVNWSLNVTCVSFSSLKQTTYFHMLVTTLPRFIHSAYF